MVSRVFSLGALLLLFQVQAQVAELPRPESPSPSTLERRPSFEQLGTLFHMAPGGGHFVHKNVPHIVVHEPQGDEAGSHRLLIGLPDDSRARLRTPQAKHEAIPEDEAIVHG